MLVTMLGSSIEAKTEESEDCYSPPARAVSSVGRAPARQTNQTSCVGSSVTVQSGDNPSWLSQDSASCTDSPPRPFRAESGIHVAKLLPSSAFWLKTTKEVLPITVAS